jgi:hypothetical protein
MKRKKRNVVRFFNFLEISNLKIILRYKMPHKLCLTGKTFKGCVGTSIYGNLDGVEIVNSEEIDFFVELAETYCTKVEVVFGKKLSCNSWSLKGSAKGKYGENSLTGVARLDKDGTIRLAYCGSAAIPVGESLIFGTLFVNAECHIDEHGNLNFKANGNANEKGLSFNEFIVTLCLTSLQEGCLKRVCK